MLPWSRFLLLIVALTVGGLLGCGGNDSKPEPPNIPGESSNQGGGSTGRYPAENRGAFLRECTAQPGATQPECECALQKIEARVSFSDFKRADAATLNGSPVDPQVQAVFNSAIADCGGRASKGGGTSPAPESPAPNGSGGPGPEPPRGPGGESLDTIDKIREQCLSQARQLPPDGRRQKGIADCNEIGK